MLEFMLYLNVLYLCLLVFFSGKHSLFCHLDVFAASLLGSWASHPSASLKVFWVLRTAMGGQVDDRFLLVVFSLKHAEDTQGTKNDIHGDTMDLAEGDILYTAIVTYFRFGWTIVKGGRRRMKFQFSMGWRMLGTKSLNNMVGTSDELNQTHTTWKIKNCNWFGRET